MENRIINTRIFDLGGGSAESDAYDSDVGAAQSVMLVGTLNGVTDGSTAELEVSDDGVNWQVPRVQHPPTDTWKVAIDSSMNGGIVVLEHFRPRSRYTRLKVSSGTVTGVRAHATYLRQSVEIVETRRDDVVALGVAASLFTDAQLNHPDGMGAVAP